MQRQVTRMLAECLQIPQILLHSSRDLVSRSLQPCGEITPMRTLSQISRDTHQHSHKAHRPGRGPTNLRSTEAVSLTILVHAWTWARARLCSDSALGNLLQDLLLGMAVLPSLLLQAMPPVGVAVARRDTPPSQEMSAGHLGHPMVTNQARCRGNALHSSLRQPSRLPDIRRMLSGHHSTEAQGSHTSHSSIFCSRSNVINRANSLVDQAEVLVK
mmetsp:Transcript_8886/g.15953  ORF Transcript_8886/g.15953 Transcript_8886/m.15953 type:complete len:215 (+) Transcript_8886:410-1054(+)